MSEFPRLMTLAEAAERISPALTADSLRTEAKRGRLHITRVAGKSFVTESDLREMLDKCRGERKDHGSTCASDQGGNLSGSCSTEAKSTALVAAKETLRELKERSRATSAKSTNRRSALAG